MRISSRNSRTPFVMVDKAVLMNESLSIYDKAVYCILCAYADKDSRSCFPSYQTIARKAGCSRRKAISVVAHLDELGLIEKKEQRNSIGDSTSNLYTVKPMNVSAEQSGKDNALADEQQALPTPIVPASLQNRTKKATNCCTPSWFQHLSSACGTR